MCVCVSVPLSLQSLESAGCEGELEWEKESTLLLELLHRREVG